MTRTAKLQAILEANGAEFLDIVQTRFETGRSGNLEGLIDYAYAELVETDSPRVILAKIRELVNA